MVVERVVPNLRVSNPESTAQFYADILGLQPVMQLGWITTLADPLEPHCQISLVGRDASAAQHASASVQVDDIEAAYDAATRCGADIVHPLTTEPWGVRRFFVRDPDGNVVNVLAHQTPLRDAAAAQDTVRRDRA